MLKDETLKLLEGRNIDFVDVYSVCAGKVYLYQKRLMNYFGNYERWDTDVTKGELVLDGSRVFDVEYIGTTLEGDPYWYSAELEEVIPDEFVRMMVKVRETLTGLNLTDLAQGKILLEGDVIAHNLAKIYTAFASEDVCYFKGTGKASIYMFVKGLPSEIYSEITPLEFTTVIMDTVKNTTADGKLLVLSTLIENNIDYEETDNEVKAKFKGNIVLTIKFDDKNRITGIEGNLS